MNLMINCNANASMTQPLA